MLTPRNIHFSMHVRRAIYHVHQSNTRNNIVTQIQVPNFLNSATSFEISSVTAIFPPIAKPSKFSPRFEEMEVCIPNSRRGSKTEESVSPTKVLESPILARVLNLWVMVRPEGFEVWQGRRGDVLQ